MADRRAWAKIGARTLGGVIGAGVAAAVIVGATLLPLPQFAISAPVQTVVPVPAAQQRVCPGPVLALAADASEATRPSALGDARTTFGTDGPDVQVDALKPDADTTSGSQAPHLLTVATPEGAKQPPLFAGAQAQNVATPDTAGLAAAACSEPAADTWLVAGSTALGQTSLVLLTNPTEVDATVDLAIYTETGRVDAPGATGIVVPAGAQKVVPLAGLAPSATAPAVHVTTTGGEVTAIMQQSFEQGIQPRGVELTGATGAPSRVQRISGMIVASLAAVKLGQSGESVGVDFPAVRILVPGDTDAKVTVGVVGESGTAVGTAHAQTVKAGNVAEIPLNDLKDGSYTVTIDSSVPVVASARTSVIGGKARDFAWFVSSAPLGDAQLVAIPDAPSPVLHFANPEEKDVTVTIRPASGASITVKVPAEGGANYGLRPGIYTLTGVNGLTVSLSMLGDGVVSSFPLSPPGALAAPLQVYPR